MRKKKHWLLADSVCLTVVTYVGNHFLFLVLFENEYRYNSLPNLTKYECGAI